MTAWLSRVDEIVRHGLRRLAALDGRWWLFIAMAGLTALFWAAARTSAVSIDGVRYHYLDDDQMISMRYARNLAEGHGLVWNGGERVEGYTNFGWTLVMAAVHALGAGDATAALWVRSVNWLLACLALVITSTLLDRLGVRHGVTKGAVLVALTLSYDLLFWAINGFETTLLTVLFLWGLVRALDDARRGMLDPGTCLIAGLLPVVRSDAADLTAAVLIVAVALGARHRRWAILLACLPLALHLGFRLTYYGDLLPNTYYLKVAGREQLFVKGLGAIKEFLATYPVAVVLAMAAALQADDTRLRVVASVVALGCIRLLLIGPDIFGGARFLAPYVPVVLAGAAAAIERVSAGPVRAVAPMAAVLAISTAFTAGINGGASFRQLVSLNGVPAANVVAGVVINRHALPDTRIVVSAAGCLSYFGRRHVIDLLGKSDRHVARLPDVPGQPTGHSRFDIDWSLRDRPDLIAPVGSSSDFLRLMDADVPWRGDYAAALARNAAFRREYRALAFPVPQWVQWGIMHVHERSPERDRVATWRQPVVSVP